MTFDTGPGPDCTKECSEPGCTETFKDHRWGHSAAHKRGWFLQRNGDAWCPQHVPAWVESWRMNKTLALPKNSD